MRPPRYYDQDLIANGGRINGVPLVLLTDKPLNGMVPRYIADLV